jgi:hypothetical protein
MAEDNERKEASESGADTVDDGADSRDAEDGSIDPDAFSQEMIDELGDLFGNDEPQDDALGDEPRLKAGDDGDADPSAVDEQEEETVEMSRERARSVVDTDELDPEVRDRLGEALAGEAEPEFGDILDNDDLADTLAALAQEAGDATSEDAQPDEEGNVADKEQEEESTEETSDEVEDSQEESGQEDTEQAEAEQEQEDSAETSQTDDSDDSDSDDGSDSDDVSHSDDGSETSDAEGSFGEDDEGLVAGVFRPDDPVGVQDDESGDLGEDDLEGYEPDQSISGSRIMGILGISILVIAAGGYAVLAATGQTERFVHLMKGDLREWERAKSIQAQDEHEEKMNAQLPKYGTLNMRGNPLYSLIKLNGEVQYGKTPKSGEWKALRLTPGTSFQGLDAEKTHKLTVTSPGHETFKHTLTPGQWNPVSGSKVEVQKAITANLTPMSRDHQIEFMQRMQKDTENNFFGEVTIKSKPKGATIIFDGDPLLNEDGEEMKTPVTFKKYYKRDKKKDDAELVEKKIRVDTPPDRGHKIQLRMPDSDLPKYVSPLERQMWTCNWKDEDEIEDLEEDAPYTSRCNYTYTLDLNFNKLQSYIEERKKQRKQIEKANEKMKEMQKAGPDAPGAVSKAGASGSSKGGSNKGE